MQLFKIQIRIFDTLLLSMFLEMSHELWFVFVS